MNLWQRIKEWWSRDTFEFEYDPEYDRIHSEINENPMILIDGIKSND